MRKNEDTKVFEALFAKIFSEIPVHHGKYYRTSDLRKAHAKVMRIIRASLKKVVTPKKYAEVMARLDAIEFSPNKSRKEKTV
jgi:hypothetical protein